VRGLHFIPNQNSLASASEDCTIKLWDVKLFSSLKDLEMTNCFEPYITLRGHSKPILSMVGSDSDCNNALQNIIISGSSNGQIRMWKTPTCSDVNAQGDNADLNFCVQTWDKTHDG
jgi:WD40 repeat protein